MNIESYTGWFHDGTLFDIVETKENVKFSVESAVLKPSDIDNSVRLSSRSTLRGIICVENMHEKLIDENPCEILPRIPKTRSFYPEILDLEIHDNGIFFLIQWPDNVTKNDKLVVNRIEIKADKIYWINTPDEEWY